MCHVDSSALWSDDDEKKKTILLQTPGIFKSSSSITLTYWRGIDWNYVMFVKIPIVFQVYKWSVLLYVDVACMCVSWVGVSLMYKEYFISAPVSSLLMDHASGSLTRLTHFVTIAVVPLSAYQEVLNTVNKLCDSSKGAVVCIIRRSLTQLRRSSA